EGVQQDASGGKPSSARHESPSGYGCRPQVDARSFFMSDRICACPIGHEAAAPRSEGALALRRGTAAAAGWHGVCNAGCADPEPLLIMADPTSPATAFIDAAGEACGT